MLPTQAQARLMWLALTGLAIAVLVALGAALVWGLGRILAILSPVLWPLAVAAVVACLLDPLVDFIQHKGVSRPRSILCVFGLALVIVGAVVSSVGPPLVNETGELASRVPAYATRLGERLNAWTAHPPLFLRKLLGRDAAAAGPADSVTTTNEPAQSFSTNLTGNATAGPTNSPPLLDGLLGRRNLEAATTWLARGLPKAGSWIFGELGRVAGLVLVPVYAFYFLLEKRGITSRWTDYLPVADSGFKRELVFVLNSINNYLVAFFRGQLLVAITDGILYGIGFLLIGLPYALLLGAAAVFLTMIPFLGAIIIFLTALLIALVQFGDWLHPVLVLVVFGVVQTLESLVISPRIMGGRVGLHPVMIIIAVMAGTTLLGGLLGGILAIPLTAALRVVMVRYVWKKPQSESA